ncbi:MAG TPA: hypothetical protein PLZ55_15555 [bacterium]|nr:hypothetical protein [bacterium]
MPIHDVDQQFSSRHKHAGVLPHDFQILCLGFAVSEAGEQTHGPMNGVRTKRNASQVRPNQDRMVVVFHPGGSSRIQQELRNVQADDSVSVSREVPGVSSLATRSIENPAGSVPFQRTFGELEFKEGPFRIRGFAIKVQVIGTGKELKPPIVGHGRIGCIFARCGPLS